MDIIRAIYYQSLPKNTTFSNYLLIVDVYYRITNLYGMENITTEEVMDKLDMFQARSGRVNDFFWWDTEIIKTDAGTKFTTKYFQ